MLPPFLVNNWKPIIEMLGVFAFAAFMVICGYKYGVSIEHARGAKDLTAQIAADTKSCDQDKQLTKEASDDFQAKLAARDSELARVKRLHPNTCIPITSRPAVGVDGNAVGRQPDSGNGIASDALFDFAGRCEGDRLKALGLQDFLTKTWKAKGQNP